MDTTGPSHEEGCVSPDFTSRPNVEPLLKPPAWPTSRRTTQMEVSTQPPITSPICLISSFSGLYTSCGGELTLTVHCLHGEPVLDFEKGGDTEDRLPTARVLKE